MEKSNLIKLFLVTLLVVVLLTGMSSTFVYAAETNTDDDGFGDLTSTLNNSNSNGNGNTNSNLNLNSNSNSNSSIYNNTNANLPYTGITDSLPVAMLVVIFGISAIYAYKKVKEYRNI